MNDYLLMSGSCTQLSTLRGSSGTGTLSSSTGNIAVSYANIENITATGGASFVVNDSYDLGGNSGWTINSTTAKDYYWVGGGRLERWFSLGTFKWWNRFWLCSYLSGQRIL